MSMKPNSEKGASAILIASSMILLLGFAAIAVDAGAGMGQRRQNQTAADVAAMAGAVESLRGGTAVVSKVLEYAQKNIPGVPAGSWQAMWQACVDPAADRNTQAGDNFVALSPPAGWVVAQPANWCISFDSAKGLLRVRIPNQTTNAEFGRAIGTSSLTTKAAAVSQLVTRDLGGVLPFGLGNGASGGDHVCLSSGPSGLAVDPCDGSTTGNYGTLKARQFGNLFLGTDQNCNASPLGQTLAQNIAIGYDHVIVTDLDGLVANEVRDECTNPFVDTLNTDTGFPGGGTEEGLVGPVPPTSTITPTARLKKVGPFTSPIFNANRINDEPLWSYLLAQGAGPDYNGLTGSTADDAPLICDPAGFASGPATVDYDGDGTLDNPNSWQHMERCLRDYVTSGSGVIMFSETILANNSRFAYVPQFWEDDLGTGNSWNHIRRFRAVYLNATVWKKGPTYAFHTPGENCTGCNSNGWALKQLTAFVFPDSSLPPILRGDPPPGSLGLQPFDVFLAR